MSFTDTTVTILVLLGLIYVVYTGIKKQSLRDTFDEVKDLFTRKGES